MAWTEYEAGGTIGLQGTEGGTIFRDEEYVGESAGARITLERECKFAPYAITCGVYGWLVHTRFIADEPTAISEYEKMQPSLARIVDMIGADGTPDDPDALDGAVAQFTEQYA